MMKRFLLILGILLLAGCTKDTPNPIVGTWALVDYTAINLRTGNKMNASTDVQTWTFNESGSAYVNGATPLTYTIKDRQLSMKYVSSGKEILYEIEDLSDSSLKVYWRHLPGAYQDGSDCWYSFTRMK